MSDTSSLPTAALSPNLAGTPAAFAQRSLTSGEVVSSYDELLVRFIDTVEPADIVEDVWVRDIVDLQWEILRLRRLKAAVMTGHASDGVYRVLLNLDVPEAYANAKKWAARDAGVVADFDELLGRMGLTMDHVMAQTLCLHIDAVERIDRMTMAAEARRNLALREIAQYRAQFAARLQRAAEAAEREVQGEFEVVPPQTGQTAPSVEAGQVPPGTIA